MNDLYSRLAVSKHLAEAEQSKSVLLRPLSPFQAFADPSQMSSSATTFTILCPQGATYAAAITVHPPLPPSVDDDDD